MILQNFQNYIFAHEQWCSSGSTEKLSQSSFLWTVKTMFLLFYFTDNINIVPHIKTLFLLVLPHRKWKPCFSLSCATENGNPGFSLFCVTENGNPLSPCFRSQKMETPFLLVLPLRKTANLSFLEGFFDFSSST
jgi:hypothetical protein